MEKDRYSELTLSEVFRSGFVSLHYDASYSLLIVKWERQIDLDERKEGFLKALEFSVEHNVLNWLINDEEIFVITTAEQKWIENEWTELVAKSDIQKIAVWHPDHYNSLVTFTEFTQRAQKKYRQHGTTHHEVFMDFQTALEWLLAEEDREG
ncbi:hypothetical protein [Pontibacter litorisediminis]|uniref:hypothetical protein n=1 Tax=Pontibacter litorisediminis TaxID=1846260 RepID=UPI0023EB0003|nr:hypothetical protein [Pontibacter litorisediminis]